MDDCYQTTLNISLQDNMNHKVENKKLNYYSSIDNENK